MSIRHSGMIFAVALALSAFCGTAQAGGPKDAAQKAKEKTVWIHPVIAKFGGVHPRTDVDMQPDPAAVYKVFVDVVSHSKDPTRMDSALQRLARLVNLMGYAKVPPRNVHIVALLDERAGMAALTDKAYARMAGRFDPKQAKNVTGNPNLPIIHALKKAGVKLMICSQAMAGLGLKDSDIDPSVTITLSGLTDPVIYGHRGYTFMRL
jgi:intracellular sulfur oxidation DsrE/DsrF family protein